MTSRGDDDDPTLLPLPEDTPGRARVPKPSDPLMGAYKESYEGAGDWFVTSGGKPLADWSGLDPKADNPDGNYRQQRPISASSQRKLNKEIIEGLSPQFKLGFNINDFRDDVNRHLEKCGLDTIAYLPSIRNDTEVANVVTEYPRFVGSLSKSLTVARTIKENYDQFDRDNSNLATEFLLNSLDSTLKKRVYQVTKKGDTFACYWMNLMKVMVSISSKHYEDVRGKVRSCSPKAYSQENISQMVQDVLIHISELECAGQYDPQLTLTMIKSIQSTCSQQGDFAFELFTKIKEVSNKLRLCKFLPFDEANAIMLEDNLDPESVLEFVQEKYEELLNDKDWVPAQRPVDRAAPSINNVLNGFSNEELQSKLLAALVQVESSKSHDNKKKTPENSPCHICGKLGHWAPNCPQKRKTSESKGDSKNSKTTGTEGNGSKEKSWKKSRPGPGEPESKMVNKKEFFWCEKCKRWTTTHSTDTHRGSSKETVSTDINVATYMNMDPSVWLVSESTSESFVPPIDFGYFNMGSISMAFGYMALTLYFLPTFGLTRTTCLVGLAKSIYDLSIDASSEISQFWYTALVPLLEHLWSTGFEFVSLVSKLPLTTTFAPLLWCLLFISVTYLESESCPSQEVVSQSRIRNGRTSDKGVNRWYRSHRRRTLSGSRPKKLSLRRRLKLRSALAQMILPFFGLNSPSKSDLCSYSESNKSKFTKKRKSRNKKRNRNRKRHWFKSTSRPIHGSCLSEPANVHQSIPNIPGHQQVFASSGFNLVNNLGSESHKAKTFPLIWDSGASVCVTNNRSDFIEFSPNSSISSLGGYAIGHEGEVKGQGTVLWSVETENGVLRTLKLPAYYLPSCKYRLVSTNAVVKAYEGEQFNIGANGGRLSGIPNDSIRGPIFVPLNQSSNLLVSMAHEFGPFGSQSLLNVSSHQLSVPEVNRDNLNLSESEKELLRWHERLGHIAFHKVQNLMRSGVLAMSESARRIHRSASQLKPIRCAACLFAKQRARSAPGLKTSLLKHRSGILKNNSLQPGQEVSVDHFICSQKGRLFTSRGKTSDSSMYSGGCIFVDHASGYIHVEFQSVMSSHATIESKLEYENICRDHGVIPQKYLSDNGTAFASKEFTEHLNEFKQTNRFAGVGAHHHNGVAERSIQTIMSISRAMMIHSAIHWPDMADTGLWPMAVKQATFLWNHIPDPATGLSPSDLFSKVKWNQNKFHDMHVWGCPVYVLDKRIGDGKKIPRWTPRSRRFMYMGVAPTYATSVPLVLNPESGAITPQFHVVFDDSFSTVTALIEDLPNFQSAAWQNLFGDSSFQYVPDDSDLEAVRDLSLELEEASDSAHASYLRNRVLDAVERARPSQPLDVPSRPPPAWRERADEPRHPSHASANGPLSSGSIHDVSPAPVLPPVPAEAPVIPPLPSASASQPSPVAQVSKPTVPTVSFPRATQDSNVESQSVLPSASSPSRSSTRVQLQPRRSRRTQGLAPEISPSTNATFLMPSLHFESYFNSIGLSTFPNSLNSASSNVDPDILTFSQALQDPNKDKWMKAAQKEINELVKHQAWLEVPRSELGDSKLVPTTWVFSKKRNPDGTIKRFKGRFCVRGDLMRGVNDTYAPVVAVSTVRVFLIMSLMLNWYTCTLDFSNAFIQAERPTPIYIQTPRGFKTREGYVLKLMRSLYGAKDAPKLWCALLFKALKKFGLTQSEQDPCLWFSSTFFIIIFLDDCDLCYKEETKMNEFLTFMEKEKFKFTQESTFAAFLGIKYEKQPSGSVKLTQMGLISKIIEATGMTNCNPNRLPASREALGIDPNGEAMNEDWNYASVVGMLLYLSTNTRPDIAFAVSQIARFTHNPKQSHATAVKIIIRHLKGTASEGTIVNKAIKLTLTCHCDADFAGLFKKDPDTAISSAKSRTGYIVKLGECPLIWKSQLQATIALSTTESEYYALSQAMRVLLPIRALVIEMVSMITFPRHLQVLTNTFTATVYEDNTSALALATEQRLTSRTRHYHVRYHHFWSSISDGNVEVVYVETTQQDADYLNKMASFEVFACNRRRVQGW